MLAYFISYYKLIDKLSVFYIFHIKALSCVLMLTLGFTIVRRKGILSRRSRVRRKMALNSGRQPNYSTINTGEVQQTDITMRGFGKTHFIGGDAHKGCFWRANLVISNTQGVTLLKYWYFKGLVFAYVFYFMIMLGFSLLHVGTAVCVFIVDILFVILFSQYVYVAHTIIPSVLKHPIMLSLELINRINVLLEVEIREVEGRYAFVRTVNNSGVQENNIETPFNEATSAGLIQVTASNHIVRFQAISLTCYMQIRRTQLYSYFLLMSACFHLLFALYCMIVIPTVTKGGASFVFT